MTIKGLEYYFLVV